MSAILNVWQASRLCVYQIGCRSIRSLVPQKLRCSLHASAGVGSSARRPSLGTWAAPLEHESSRMVQKFRSFEKDQVKYCADVSFVCLRNPTPA